MTGVHESTLALSIYTALTRAGDMSTEQALALLKRAWDERLEEEEVAQGLTYLLERKLVTVGDGVIRATRHDGGAAATVVRHPLRQTELVYGGAL